MDDDNDTSCDDIVAVVEAEADAEFVVVEYMLSPPVKAGDEHEDRIRLNDD